jgi:hypothetical protein
MVSGGDERNPSLKLWDVDSASCIATLEKANPTNVGELMDGRIVFTTKEPALRVWDGEAEHCDVVLPIHVGSEYGAMCMAVLANGCVATGSDDCNLEVLPDVIPVTWH